MTKLVSVLDVLPTTNAGYGTLEYWEERYKASDVESTFEWFKDWAALKPHVEPYLPRLRPCKVLILGCGNSGLSADLADEGFEVTSIDYSPTVIEQMRSQRPDLGWVVGDVRQLPFADGSFDVCFDKGTMDAMMTAKDLDVWNPPPEVVENCRREVDEVIRVLKPGAESVFLYATFGQPHFRRPHLKREPEWRTQTVTLNDGNGFDYFLYVMSRANADT